MNRLKSLLCYTLLWFPLFSRGANNAHLELLGLYVNDKEINTLDTLVDGDTYYLPYDLVLKYMGITPVDAGEHLTFNSPLGSAKIKKNRIRRYQQTAYVSLNTFKPLGVNAVYHTSSLAIKLYVPWDSQHPFGNKRKKKPTAIDNRAIDYYPDNFSLHNVNISGGTSYQHQHRGSGSNSRQQYLQLGADGQFYGGLWGAQLHYSQRFSRGIKQQNARELTEISNLFWQKSSRNWALRLGNNQNSYGVGGGNYTGATFAYSNKGIRRHLYIPNSGSRQLLGSSYYNDVKNITGTGPAGGIAELRINDRPVARVRIALDKRYEFIGLNLSRIDRDNQKIEVALYEYSTAEKPIKIDKPFLTERRANVGTHELLLELGAGRVGNAFDWRQEHQKDKTRLVHAYAEFGLFNNIALRGGWSKTINPDSHNDEQLGLLGANIGLPWHFNWDIAYEYAKHLDNYHSYLSYDGKYIDANYSYDYDQYKTVGSDGRKWQSQEQLNLHFSPFERFNLTLNGNQNKANKKVTERYFTGNAFIRLHNHLSARISRDRYNNYGYGISLNIPKLGSSLSADWDKDDKSLSLSTTLTPSLSVGASVSQHQGEQKHYHANLNYTYNDYHKFHIGYNYFDKDNGYEFDWNYRPHNYGSVTLGYRKNQSRYDRDTQESLLSERDYFFLNFSFDFIKHVTDGWQAGHQRPSYYGTVIADISVEDKENLVLDDKIQLNLDKYSVSAYKTSGNRYLIENVKAGVYQLSFPADSLPLEYQSDLLKKPVIKVSNSAQTIIPYHLKKTVGFSGKLNSEKENVVINVYQNGKKITQTHSNAYGYYQIIGLAAGIYQVKTQDSAEKTVQLGSEFLFEVDL